MRTMEVAIERWAWSMGSKTRRAVLIRRHAL
jgi:hypothetical protein